VPDLHHLYIDYLGSMRFSMLAIYNQDDGHMATNSGLNILLLYLGKYFRGRAVALDIQPTYSYLNEYK